MICRPARIDDALLCRFKLRMILVRRDVHPQRRRTTRHDRPPSSVDAGSITAVDAGKGNASSGILPSGRVWNGIYYGALPDNVRPPPILRSFKHYLPEFRNNLHRLVSLNREIDEHLTSWLSPRFTPALCPKSTALTVRYFTIPGPSGGAGAPSLLENTRAQCHERHGCGVHNRNVQHQKRPGCRPLY
jgi:hypothetical protein